MIGFASTELLCVPCLEPVRSGRILSEFVLLSVVVCSVGGEVCWWVLLSGAVGDLPKRSRFAVFRVKRLQPGSATSPREWP